MNGQADLCDLRSVVAKLESSLLRQLRCLKPGPTGDKRPFNMDIVLRMYPGISGIPAQYIMPGCWKWGVNTSSILGVASYDRVIE
jgi:hypothetical protein